MIRFAFVTLLILASCSSTGGDTPDAGSSDAATPTSGGESTEDARSPVPTPVDTAAALVVRRKKSSSSRKPAPY